MSATRVEVIRQRIEQKLAPTRLEVIDEGHLHAGHAGEGQGHFRVCISCAAFAGKTPIQCHRLVYAALDDLIDDGIHALAIEVRTSDPV